MKHAPATDKSFLTACCVLPETKSNVLLGDSRQDGPFSLKMDFKLEALPNTIYACFVLHNYWETDNLNIDKDLVMTQIELMKENEVQFKNIPDPVYSCNVGEGIVVMKILTDLVMNSL